MRNHNEQISIMESGVEQKISTNWSKLQKIVEAVDEKIGVYYLAVIMMGVSQIIWPVSFLFVNEEKFNPFQTLLVRGISVVLSHLIILKYFGFSLDFTKQNHKILMARHVIMLIHQWAYTAIMFYLPLPIINTLAMSGTLFIFVVDYLQFGTKITPQQMLGVFIGLAGVIITINGDYLLAFIQETHSNHSDFQHYSTTDPTTQLILSILFVFLSFMWSYAIVITKMTKNLNGIQVSYHLGFCLIYGSSLIYPYQFQDNKESAKSWLAFVKAVLLSGLPMALVQILFLLSLKLTAHTGVLTLMTFVTVIVSYLISILRYNEDINYICLCGVICILYGLYKAVKINI